MITANHYAATAQAVADAIEESKHRNHVTTIEAWADVAAAVRLDLAAECEGDDGDTYWGEDCDGNHWSVRVLELAP